MDKTQRQLLENLLDCLDRLYDGDSHVIDVRDLVYATHAALGQTDHAAIMGAPAKDLIDIARSNKTRQQQKDAALGATDDLRRYLATILPPS